MSLGTEYSGFGVGIDDSAASDPLGLLGNQKGPFGSGKMLAYGLDFFPDEDGASAMMGICMMLVGPSKRMFAMEYSDVDRPERIAVENMWTKM